jgi:hypothetical protein
VGVKSLHGIRVHFFIAYTQETSVIHFSTASALGNGKHQFSSNGYGNLASFLFLDSSLPFVLFCAKFREPSAPLASLTQSISSSGPK